VPIAPSAITTRCDKVVRRSAGTGVLKSADKRERGPSGIS
jgi:hypothetical protein